MATFTVREYLKGGGPKILTVSVSTEGRDTQWDAQDVILFLNSPESGSTHHTFIDTTAWNYGFEDYHAQEYTGGLPEGYTLGTRNPVWVPAQNSGPSRMSFERSVTSRSEPGISPTAIASLVSWMAGESPPPGGLARDAVEEFTRSPGSRERDGDAEYSHLLIRHAVKVTISNGARPRCILSQHVSPMGGR